METAVATPARPATEVAVPFPLRDVEDLYDADLDGVLADLLGRPGQAALFAHMLSARALLLAVL
jgi:hypothetical protein